MNIKYLHIVLLFSCAVVTSASMGMEKKSSASSGSSTSSAMDTSSSSSSSTSSRAHPTLPPLPADDEDLDLNLSALSVAHHSLKQGERPTALVAPETVGTIEFIEPVKTDLQDAIDKGNFAQANTLLSKMSKAEIAGEYISSLLRTAKSSKVKGSSALHEQRANLITKLASLTDSPVSSPASGAEDEHKKTTDASPKRNRSKSPKR